MVSPRLSTLSIPLGTLLRVETEWQFHTVEEVTWQLVMQWVQITSTGWTYLVGPFHTMLISLSLAAAATLLSTWFWCQARIGMANQVEATAVTFTAMLTWSMDSGVLSSTSWRPIPGLGTQLLTSVTNQLIKATIATVTEVEAASKLPSKSWMVCMVLETNTKSTLSKSSTSRYPSMRKPTSHLSYLRMGILLKCRVTQVADHILIRLRETYATRWLSLSAAGVALGVKCHGSTKTPAAQVTATTVPPS